MFYSQDFLIGCADLTMEERGQYITLLCLQHQKGHISEKSLKLSVPNISADVLKKFMRDSDGNYYNERLALETQKRNRFVQHQVDNINLRWEEKESNSYQTDTKSIPNDIPNDEIGMRVGKDLVHTKSIPLETETEIRNKNKKKETENDIPVKESLQQQKIRLLKQRKQVFEIQVLEFHGTYPEKMLQNFFDYWTEMNKSCSQMRWEMERTWELKRRLTTWASREKSFPIKADLISYKELVRRYNDGETDMWERYEQVIPGDKRSLWKQKK